MAQNRFLDVPLAGTEEQLEGDPKPNRFLTTTNRFLEQEEESAFGRIVDAATERFAESTENVGFSQETQEFFEPITRGPMGRFNRSVLNLAESGLAALETAGAVAESAISGITQSLRELGMGDGDADRLERDLHGLLTSAGIVTGAAMPQNLSPVVRAIDRLPKSKRPQARKIVSQELESARLKIGQVEELSTPQALSFADRQFSQITDALRPIKIAARRGAEREGITPDLSPYRDMRLVAGSKGTIQAAIERGALARLPNGDVTFAGKSLNEVLRPLEGKLDDAMMYFAGKRAQELKSQGREKLFTDEEIGAMLNMGDDIPLFEKAFQEFQQYNRQMLEFAEQSGLLSPEQKAAFLEAGQNYVPFYRVAEEGGARPGASLFQRLKGGEANVNDVLENIVKNTAMIVDASVKNHAKLQVYDMIDRFDLGEFAVRSKATPQAVKVVDDKIREELERIGADPDMTMAFTYNRPFDESVDVVFRNGQREYWEIKDPLFLTAMRHNNPRSYPLAIQIMGGFKNVLTRGVTMSPDFLIRNLIRDSQAAFIQSRSNKFIPLASSLRGMKDRMLKSDEYWQMLANGGGFSTLYKGDVQQSARLKDMYRSAGVDSARVLDSPKKLLDVIEEVTSSFEEGTRLAEFSQLTRQGTSLRDAAFSAREVSTDFALRGGSTTVQNLMATLPFTNARMQGLIRLGREGKENPATVATKGLMAMTVPALTLYALNKDDDRYKGLPDWIKDQHYVFFLPGQEDAYMVPKGFEYGALFSTVPERFMETIEQRHGKRFADAMLRMFVDTFSVSPPQAFAPALDIATNERFGGVSIVPEDLKDVKPSEQFRPWTSDTMVEMSQALSEHMGVEVSPMQVESLVVGYLGTMGMYALDASDYLMRLDNKGESPTSRIDELPVVRSFVRQEPVRGTSFETDFYELLSETRQVTATVNKMISEGRRPDLSDEERERFALAPMMDRLSRVAATINNQMRLIQQDENLPADEKRQELDRLQAAKNKLFQQLAEQLPEDIAEQEGIVQ